MKKYLHLLFIIAAMAAITGCARKQPYAPWRGTGVTPEDLMEARNTYIGDASADDKLIGLAKKLYDIQAPHTMELQTERHPFGLTLHFEEEPDNISMQKAGALLLVLIDNCYSVSWDYPVDLNGDREYYYLSSAVAYHFNSDSVKYVKKYNSSKSKLEEFLQIIENIQEPLKPRAKTETIEKAVAAATLEYNNGKYLIDHETCGEGNIMLDMEQSKDNITTVYALTLFGTFQFQDGKFVMNDGSGITPAVIRLLKEPDGRFVTLDYHQVSGSKDDLEASVKEVFPEKLWESCIFPSEKDQTELKNQVCAYAKEYLETIGRKATVGYYGEFPHTYPIDEGIPPEIYKKISDSIKYSAGPGASAPAWLGNVECLEDGVRYIYQQDYDTEKQEIIFSKLLYETREIIQKEVYDATTGKQKTK